MCFLVLESCNFSHVGHVKAVHYSIIKFNKFQRILFLSQLFVAFAQDLKTLNARATACRIPFALWNKSLSPKPQLAGRCERCLSFPSEWSIQYKGSMPMIQPMTTPTTDPVVFTRLAEACSSCINDNPCGGKPAIYNDIKHRKWRATRMSKQNREIDKPWKEESPSFMASFSTLSPIKTPTMTDARLPKAAHPMVLSWKVAPGGIHKSSHEFWAWSLSPIVISISCSNKIIKPLSMHPKPTKGTCRT